MNHHRIQTLIALIAAMLIVPGCATWPLSKSKRASILAGKETLILLRVEITVSGNPNDRFGERLSLGEGFELNLTQFGDKVGSCSRSFDEESKQQGWVYALIDDGTYYLNFNDLWSFGKPLLVGETWRVSNQDFRFDVPKDAPVVYIGTLRPKLVIGSVMYGYKKSDFRVDDESFQARGLLAKHFPEAVNPRTILMRIDDGSTRVIRTSSDAPHANPDH